MTDQDRKEFEAWARSKNYNTSIFDDGTYVFADIQVMSDAWLAARRTQSKQVRELVEAVVKYGKAMHERLVAEAVDENGIAAIENVLYDNEELAATAMFDLAAQLKEQDDDE